jgi:hypothetical protein
MIAVAKDPAAIVAALETDGLVLVENLVAPAALEAMQEAFAHVLEQMNWNTARGYQRTDRHRLMVEDILILDPAFQELALHPDVKTAMRQYIGDHFVLSEVRGWETVATRDNFHGWHNDAWYDHDLPEVPREVKLGLYLTDVESGHFSYIKGSHIQNRHRHWNDREIAPLQDRIAHVKGHAGATFLFDTAGIHRQSSPVLKPRRVVFFNYHDSRIPLQEIDRKAYRYHPLVLNAAFLGEISPEDQRILGFGNRSKYQPGHRPDHRYRRLAAAYTWLFTRVIEAESARRFAATGLDFVKRKLGSR